MPFARRLDFNGASLAVGTPTSRDKLPVEGELFEFADGGAGDRVEEDKSAWELPFALARQCKGRRGQIYLPRVRTRRPGVVATEVGSSPAAKGEPGTGVRTPVFASIV